MTSSGNTSSTPTLEVPNHSSILNADQMGKRVIQASKEGKLQEVQQLVQVMIGEGGGVDCVNYKNSKNWTALHFATYLGRHEVTEYLLSMGADVNAVCDKTSNRYKGGETCLHFAVDNCDVKMACLLLDYGADLSIHNKARQTPLDAAASINVISKVSSYWKQKQQQQITNEKNSLQNHITHNNQEEMIIAEVCASSSNILGFFDGSSGVPISPDDDELTFSNQPPAKRMKIEEHPVDNRPNEATKHVSSGKDVIAAMLQDLDIQIANLGDSLSEDFTSLRGSSLMSFQEKLSIVEANQKKNVEALREQLTTTTRRLLDSK